MRGAAISEGQIRHADIFYYLPKIQGFCGSQPADFAIVTDQNWGRRLFVFILSGSASRAAIDPLTRWMVPSRYTIGWLIRQEHRF